MKMFLKNSRNKSVPEPSFCLSVTLVDCHYVQCAGLLSDYIHVQCLGLWLYLCAVSRPIVDCLYVQCSGLLSLCAVSWPIFDCLYVQCSGLLSLCAVFWPTVSMCSVLAYCLLHLLQPPTDRGWRPQSYLWDETGSRHPRSQDLIL